MAYNNGYYDYHDPRADHSPRKEQRQQVYVQIPKSQSNGAASQNLLSCQSNNAVRQPIVYDSSPSYQVQVRQGSESLPLTPSSLSTNDRAPVKTVTQPLVTQPTSQLEAHEPPIDYSLLLIDLAEDYFKAAYDRGSAGQIGVLDHDHKTFCRLIATGLGCLEVALRVCTFLFSIKWL